MGETESIQFQMKMVIHPFPH